MNFKIRESSVSVFFKTIAWVLLIGGVVIRLIVFFQNRNLFVDEANVARNIFERSYLDLAKPLSYEQYAAPVFLWLLKTSSVFLGYGEMALRLVPLLSGLASLVVMYILAKKFTSVRAFWYPLGYMVVAYFMIKYSAELKQYMIDALVVLSLLLLAIEVSIEEKTRKQFFWIWLCVGTLAIWTAMPSVFALAGIGAYYFVQAVRSKKRAHIMDICLIGILWVAQFGIYYYLVLKPQIHTSYLQKFHKEFFLYAIPKTRNELGHNWDVLKNVFQEASGFEIQFMYFNMALFAIGAIMLIKKDFAKALLVLVPLITLSAAAAFNQYSLIPRVSLFSMPIILLVIGYGFKQFMDSRWVILPIAFLFIGIRGIYWHSSAGNMFKNPLKVNEITPAMDFLQSHKITYRDLRIHHAAAPAFVYYTQMHPKKNKWSSLRDAHFLVWDENYDVLAQHPADTMAVLIASFSPDELQKIVNAMDLHRNRIAQLNNDGAIASIYTKKN